MARLRYKFKPRKQKYNAKKTVVDGKTFHSILEAERYKQLVIMKEAGEIRFFLRQVPFDCGGGVIYRLDFLIFWADDFVTLEDVKGLITQDFINKKKQVEALHGVEIEINKMGK